ncbi:MAG: hypothetical protein Q9220_001219 [cf. Caloplaca sp. 1 TL-2023]
MHPLRKKYSVDDSIDSWALFDRTFPSTSKTSPIMSRRVFDVGLDVDRIKNGLKLHSSNKRDKHNRSASTSDARPKTSSDSNQLAVVPRLKEKRSNHSLQQADKFEDLQPLSPDNEPVNLHSNPPPVSDDSLYPPSHTPTMNGSHHSPDDHMEPLHTPTDDAQNFDLKPPPPKKSVQFLETFSEDLFSDAHLRTILRDPAYFTRFTAFLNCYKPQLIPVLVRYLEIQKVTKAIEYANALAESFKAMPDDASTLSPCTAANLDEEFESRSRRATEALANDALPAYITQHFTKVVTESMVREITGTSMPAMRDLVGGLAEVFCLSDPSIPDNPIVYASEEFYRTTQYGRDYVIGRNCRFLQGPRTDRSAVARIREAVRAGQESFETILNYRRDGSPFMNLVMTAPLYDNKGVVRYYIGAQVDISGLVEQGKGMESFERLLDEKRRKGRGGASIREGRRDIRCLQEFAETLSTDESAMFRGSGDQGQGQDSRAGSVNGSEYDSRRRRNGTPRQRRRVIGHETEDEGSNENNNALVFASLGPSGKLPGVYQNEPEKQYLLLRPHPSLRIIFVSPALRIPGLLQSPFLSRIGGPAHVRSGLLSAFENGEDITAKVTWLPTGGRPDGVGDDTSSLGSSKTTTGGGEVARTRYISCTPMTGSDDKVGVWMVVMVENESVTGSLPSRERAQRERFSGNHKAIPMGGSEYEREDPASAQADHDEQTDDTASPPPAHYSSSSRRGDPTNDNDRPVNGQNDQSRGDFYAEFLRQGSAKRFHRHPITSPPNGTKSPPMVMTPPAGTGKVLGIEEEV